MPVVRSDARRAGQIVTNLLGNAIKFTDHGEVTVEMTTWATCSRYRSRIQASASPRAWSALFKPFSQAPRPGGRLYEGTGLGLAISRTLARALGGDITVASVEGGGSRFTLWLPTCGSDRAPTSVRAPARRDAAKNATMRGCDVVSARQTTRCEYRHVRGLEYHVTRWPGEDPAVTVLLHGNGDCGATFQFLVEQLPARMTLVAPDWRGFGRTAWAPDGYWFPDYYADLDAMLDSWRRPGPWISSVTAWAAISPWCMRACARTGCAASSVSKVLACRARSRSRAAPFSSMAAATARGGGRGADDLSFAASLAAVLRKRNPRRHRSSRFSSRRPGPKCCRTVVRACASTPRTNASTRSSTDAKKPRLAGEKSAHPCCMSSVQHRSSRRGYTAKATRAHAALHTAARAMHDRGRGPHAAS